MLPISCTTYSNLLRSQNKQKLKNVGDKSEKLYRYFVENNMYDDRVNNYKQKNSPQHHQSTYLKCTYIQL